MPWFISGRAGNIFNATKYLAAVAGYAVLAASVSLHRPVTAFLANLRLRFKWLTLTTSFGEQACALYFMGGHTIATYNGRSLKKCPVIKTSRLSLFESIVRTNQEC